jgi:hypothetical protein
MKNSIVKSKITAFAATVLMCCSVLFIQSNARAQCPTSSPPAPDPGTCPWTAASVHAQIPGTSCYVWVYYCYRSCLGYNLEVYTYEVDPDPGSACSGIDPNTLINDGKAIANIDVMQNVFVPPCGGSQEILVDFYSPQCWTGVAIGPTNKFTGGCQSCLCWKECNVCYNAATNSYTLYNCVIYSPTVCDCPPWPDVWISGGCYSVVCE